MDAMTGAEITATRSLLGLSVRELSRELHVGEKTITDWQRGQFAPKSGALADLRALRAAHDADLAPMLKAAEDGIPIYLPSGPRQRGWYAGLGARVLDRYPDATLAWFTP